MPETPETPKVVESTKPSKLDRAKSVAITAGITVIPTLVTVGISAIGFKTGKMQFDAAKLNLEAAKLNFPKS
jgi:hypothetical protein